MTDYSKMDGNQLLEAINRLRHQWDPTNRKLERRGRWFVAGYGVSLIREEVVAQCFDLEAGMQEHLDEKADEQIQARVPRELERADEQDRDRHERLADVLSRLPRFARMQSLAFVGLSDGEIA